MIRDLFVTAARTVRRRPVRVAEAVLALAAALGVALAPELEEHVLGLVGTLVAVGVLGGEVAQTRTTPTADPRLDDGHGRDL